MVLYSSSLLSTNSASRSRTTDLPLNCFNGNIAPSNCNMFVKKRTTILINYRVIRFLSLHHHQFLPLLFCNVLGTPNCGWLRYGCALYHLLRKWEKVRTFTWARQIGSRPRIGPLLVDVDPDGQNRSAVRRRDQPSSAELSPY